MNGNGMIVKPTLSQTALYGLPGKIVATVDPYTEADPAAILVNVLVMFGNVVGRNPYFTVEQTPHYPNLFTTLVGPSSTGRKGQSVSTPQYIFEQIDPKWVTDGITSGLSSGEGLIFRIRDPMKRGKKNDPGVADKRLLVVEEEFAQALKVMKREGNILSPMLRRAWDSRPLSPLTKGEPIKCDKPHISIVGHITPEELRKQLNEIEIANGFANRFMWFYVQRSKLISNPTGVPPQLIKPLIDEVNDSVFFVNSIRQMTRDVDAEKLWESVYPKLTADGFGLFGVITQRAAAQVLRVSMIYALTDRSSIITPPHLEAALALWEYSEESVKMIFEDMTGDANVDLVVRCGRAFKKMARTDIWRLVGKNNTKTELDRIVNVIQQRQLATLDASGNLIFN
jgi:Protein of unknown function (DUF3987)